MSITFAILDPKISKSTSSRWMVIHPTSDVVLAYCDSKRDAEAVVDAINDMPRVIRAAGRGEVR